MSTHRFYQLDVFTETPLSGNPLAVFPDADDLPAERMQAIASEMNLSETTFVMRSSKADARIRIFTPKAELPLAGHPIIGTWWLLAELGRVPAPRDDGSVSVRQETGRGVLPVEITFHSGSPTEVVMTQALPEFGVVVDDIDGLARAIGADGPTIAPSPPPQIVSTALPQLMVPIASRPALASLPSGGSGTLGNFLGRLGTDCVMLYAPDEHDERVAHCRMFAPALGVAEDPATGSAAGALGAYLVSHGVLRPTNGPATLVVHQGAEIGRPSRIRVQVATEADGTITAVRVGGQAVRVIEGEVTL